MSQTQESAVYPFLRYADARAAVDWLCDAFGFERHAVFDGPDGGVAHAELRLGSGVVMLGSRKDDALNLRTPGELNGWVTAACTRRCRTWTRTTRAPWRLARAS
jgi:uncharacterized glyoxalase superfamily protein PhnB